MSELTLDIIKADLKNDIESGLLNPQQQIIAINEALKFISILNNTAINDTIKKYRQQQREEEEKMLKAQDQIFKNAQNIYNHIINDL